jgi:hypothetical protein
MVYQSGLRLGKRSVRMRAAGGVSVSRRAPSPLNVLTS